MFIKFIKINIGLLFITSLAFAEVVKNIEINGNVRVSIETIKVLGDFDVGNDLSNNDLNNILKNLYSTDFFKDINLSLENNTLLIRIKENPVIQSIFINGIKKKNIEEELFKILSVKEKSSYVPYKIENDRSPSFIIIDPNKLRAMEYAPQQRACIAFEQVRCWTAGVKKNWWQHC